MLVSSISCSKRYARQCSTVARFPPQATAFDEHDRRCTCTASPLESQAAVADTRPAVSNPPRLPTVDETPGRSLQRLGPSVSLPPGRDSCSTAVTRWKKYTPMDPRLPSVSCPVFNNFAYDSCHQPIRAINHWSNGPQELGRTRGRRRRGLRVTFRRVPCLPHGRHVSRPTNSLEKGSAT